MSKAQTLKRAKTAQRNLDLAEGKATDAATLRDNRVWEAREAGATYADIQAATGLSISRITQVLRRVRNRPQPTAE